MALLEVEALCVNYGAVSAVRDVSLSVEQGEIVTLIGANGAGKTSILRAISKLVAPRSGVVRFDGRDVTALPPEALVRLGMAHSPEGRQVLAKQSVGDNLELGAYVRKDRAEIAKDMARMYELFPRLSERRHQSAGTLSGGEQQMLAIARALMSRPRLLLLDEPSLGLAPLLVSEIFEIIMGLGAMGTTILLVEQNARLAMRAAARTYVVESGSIVLEGPSAELAADERVTKAYLG
ncbi:MAG: ABC-type branched-chain amino acid transport system, ATPase component [Solidesulfovibrio magneticus str. Maddingley MBC34]|uniref:ABC-type branched-chain amino acid transport system, ATPase component n=1 Tax=Solidesulfovibrio magneticus str. Maddingley MBC34 TaxID=1206767 RepID=K6GPE1_9BACT|nr:MAG: ABC-type branched-chain amino acid transport system, ATPase component [Solidesulfovibrio magneticus str. Maddingley MBC34]